MLLIQALLVVIIRKSFGGKPKVAERYFSTERGNFGQNFFFRQGKWLVSAENARINEQISAEIAPFGRNILATFKTTYSGRNAERALFRSITTY